jgi:hypothetical protein
MPEHPTHRGFESLMHDVCVGHGYCGGVHDDRFMHVTDFIPESGPVTADQFVAWVYLAEYGRSEEDGYSPLWARHRQTIRNWFVEHMGSEVVDSARLKHGVQL